MAKRAQSKGQCQYCGATVAKGTATRHLAACPERKTIMEKAAQASKKAETLYYLRVQDAYDKSFWLDLEARASTTLEELDGYLRAIWLECCGHMSQFSFGGWQGQEIPMRQTIGKVLRLGDTLTHIYDFGTSSYTLVKLVETRKGAPTTPFPIDLMMRNFMPETACQECDQPAQWFCVECQIEDQCPGLLCDQHAEDHPHEDYDGVVPLVNSPRMGLCGYEGPADPPY